MIVDAWVNVWPPRFAEEWSKRRENASVGAMFGDHLNLGTSLEQLVTTMDGAGVDAAVLTVGLDRPAPGSPAAGLGPEDVIEASERFPGRFAISCTVTDPERPRLNVRRINELAQHDRVTLIHVSPLLHERYPLNHRLYYPVYAACEEAGLPVSINIGVPGPKVRSRGQDPVLLEDVLIDFPDLVVVGAHMGHPYESLLITYMLKWPNLYLSNSAYLATYMDEGLIRFMGSSRGRGRVLFASDHPVLPMARAVEAAKALPLDAEAMARFMGRSAAEMLLQRRR